MQYRRCAVRRKGTKQKAPGARGLPLVMLPIRSAASMRDDRGWLVFDARLRHIDRFGGSLVPLDRLGLARKRPGQSFVHARDWDDLEPTFDLVGDLDQVLGVLLRDQ